MMKLNGFAARVAETLLVVATLCIGGSRCDGMPILRSTRPAGYAVLDQTVALIHGKHRGEGNVQILYREEWGAVCDDNWHAADAAVVCRELGFASAGGITVSNKFRAAAYQGFKYALDEANCAGTEASLSKCSGLWGPLGNCRKEYEWAGVRCTLSHCLPGFSGTYCCPATTAARASTSKYCCPSGTAGRKCHHSDAVTCSGHGVVNDAGSCSCVAGYLGKRCQYSATSCNGNGQVDELGICSCNPGFFAPNCLPFGDAGLPAPGSENRTMLAAAPAVAEASRAEAQTADEQTVHTFAAVVAGFVLSLVLVLFAAHLVAKKKRAHRKLHPAADPLTGFALVSGMEDGGEAGRTRAQQQQQAWPTEGQFQHLSGKRDRHLRSCRSGKGGYSAASQRRRESDTASICSNDSTTWDPTVFHDPAFITPARTGFRDSDSSGHSRPLHRPPDNVAALPRWQPPSATNTMERNDLT